MDWITGIQNAVDYIERHLTVELSCEEIARQSFSSPFHFQRVFSILCGYDTPESFAKAFWPFHGITPSQARG